MSASLDRPFQASTVQLQSNRKHNPKPGNYPVLTIITTEEHRIKKQSVHERQ